MKPPYCAWLSLLLIWGALGGASVRADDAKLAAKTQAILKAYCFKCHGQNGSAKGGFNHVLDREKMVQRGYLLPGNLSGSFLYQQIAKGEMPPAGKQHARPTKEEVLTLRQWIEAGAPDFAVQVAARPFIDETKVRNWVVKDLAQFPPKRQRVLRYFTLAHLANTSAPEGDLERMRQALAKLLNSLSWHARLTPPTPLDAGRTVYRIDLRDYKWTPAFWEKLVTAYPYRGGHGSRAADALAATGSDLALLRADWFVATASRTPLYYDLLQMPLTERALERLLQVDAPSNIQDQYVARTGFNDSGVSKNNRLLERHDAAYGALWRSYDFADNTGRKNLFEHPLGPNAGETSFTHAGGEMIFHLPNGLHGYLLADGLGRRIDKGPIEIVSDPKRPDQRVEAGLSCMSCHARGYLPKFDQIRAHVEKNQNVFAPIDVSTVRALYPTKERLQQYFDEDNERYLRALKGIGVNVAEAEPVTLVTLRYEGTLGLGVAAAEFGLPVAEFAKRLQKSAPLTRTLGPLLAGGVVQREVFQDVFPELVRTLEPTLTGSKTLELTYGRTPFHGHSASVSCITFSPDGKFAASGGEDKTIRVWQVASGRELRTLTGHTDEVTCIAFSPDGKWLVSGSRDTSLRLWSVNTGKELRRLEGHTNQIRAVTFSPNNQRILSAADDKTLRWWDASNGKELRVLYGHTGPVSSVALAANGWLAVSGSHDGTLRVWDVVKGLSLRTLEGHQSEVHAVAISRDGCRAASGGRDRTVRLWDTLAGLELRTLEGHANPIIAVAFTPDQRGLLSASSQYKGADTIVRWYSLPSGTFVQGLTVSPLVRVGCVGFSPDRHLILTGGSERFLRLWQETGTKTK